jgi:hypothetical protein
VHRSEEAASGVRVDYGVQVTEYCDSRSAGCRRVVCHRARLEYRPSQAYVADMRHRARGGAEPWRRAVGLTFTSADQPRCRLAWPAETVESTCFVL